MIDWSKWHFVSNRDKGGFYLQDAVIVNQTEGISLPISFKEYEHDINTDSPDKWIKERCKNEIRRYYINKRLEQLKEQQIPVEDNLDYIENEAEKRGLNFKGEIE